MYALRGNVRGQSPPHSKLLGVLSLPRRARAGSGARRQSASS